MKSTFKKTEAKRPSHRVYAVSKSGGETYWRAIGAAWSHGDGEGFSLKLDMLPLNGAEIVVRKPKPTDNEPEIEVTVKTDPETEIPE